MNPAVQEMTLVEVAAAMRSNGTKVRLASSLPASEWEVLQLRESRWVRIGSSGILGTAIAMAITTPAVAS